MLIFDLIVYIINVFTNAIYYFFLYSAYIGRFIVLGAIALYSYISIFITTILCVIQDFIEFVTEIVHFVEEEIDYVVGSTVDGINLMQDSIAGMLRHVQEFLTGTKSFTLCLATKTGLTVVHYVEMLRYAIFLLADTCWSIITFPPKTIFRLLIAIGDFSLYAFEACLKLTLTIAIDFMNNLCRWVIGVGMITLCIVYWRYVLLLLHYYLRALFDSLSQLISLRYYMVKLRAFLRRFIPKNNCKTAVNCSSIEDSPFDDATLCVACYDRPRNILLLPCRHICLCEECKDHLFSVYEVYKCPICRSHVMSDISVYF